MERVEFTKERMSVFNKVSAEVISEIDLVVGRVDDDLIRDMFTMKMDAWFLANTADERTLTYYCDRPRFFDWLFRRNRTVEFKLEVKDLLLNPPRLSKTTRTYIVTDLTK
jgi:hypothetical protein